VGRGNACSNLRVLGVHRPGGFAEFVAVPADRVHPVPGLPSDLAVLCEPVAVALQAVERSGLLPGQDLVVIGAGGIGRAVTLAAADLGARVLVADRLPVRLRLAQAAGAVAVVNTEAEDLSERVNAFTHGRGVGVVIEATGVPQIIATALELVAPTGTVLVVGVSRSSLSLPVSVFTRKELTVVGSRNSIGQFPAAIDLVRRRRDRITGTVTHRFALAETARVFDQLTRSSEEIGKAIVEPGRRPLA
jgi:L-gulonate 5-dehydrogenase